MFDVCSSFLFSIYETTVGYSFEPCKCRKFQYWTYKILRNEVLRLSRVILSLVSMSAKNIYNLSLVRTYIVAFSGVFQSFSVPSFPGGPVRKVLFQLWILLSSFGIRFFWYLWFKDLILFCAKWHVHQLSRYEMYFTILKLSEDFGKKLWACFRVNEPVERAELL